MAVKWHQLFGKELELALTPVGIEVRLETLTMSEPPKVDVVLLRRLTATWTPEQYALLPDDIRQSRASHNLIEFKQTESVNLGVFKQALIYDELYPQGHSLPRDEVRTFILSARTPRKTALEEAGFTPGESPGVYHSSNVFMRNITLISLNELRPELNNAFVQLFASKRRVREAAFARLMEWGWERLSDAFWDFLLGLHHQWEDGGGTMKVKVENDELTPDRIMERGREIRKIWLAHLTPEELATLPVEKRLAGLAPEDRLAGLAPEERLAGLAPEERLAGLAPEERLVGLAPEERLVGLAPEERLAGLAPEQMQQLIEQIERYLDQQRNGDE